MQTHLRAFDYWLMKFRLKLSEIMALIMGMLRVSNVQLPFLKTSVMSNNLSYYDT